MGGLVKRLVEKELKTARRRIAERGNIPLDKMTQAVLIEVGHEYYLEGVLRGVISSAKGRKDTRAMRAFQIALAEAGRLADPVKKLLAQLGVDMVEDLERMVVAFQRAERHTSEDRREAACRILEDWMKSEPEVRDRLANRFGFLNEGGDDAPVAP